MNLKILVAISITINCYSICGAALRRTPKVYNALITTDDNLTSSRAYPVIQPTIHEGGLAHYPFAPYNPYGIYTPPLVRFGQPIAPGFRPPRRQLPYPLPNAQFTPQYVPKPLNPEPQSYPMPPTAQATDAHTGKTHSPQQQEQQPAPAEQQEPIKPQTLLQETEPSYVLAPIEENSPQQMPNDKVPIPLNQYGLPPALIPLPQYLPDGQTHPAMNLPPYGFNQYPLIYDSITGFREQYLPPYEYYPSHTFTVVGGGTPAKTPAAAQPQHTPNTQTPTSVFVNESEANSANPPPPASVPEETIDVPSFENIKNGSKSKDSGVPDVPPPPIPSGAKSKQ